MRKAPLWAGCAALVLCFAFADVALSFDNSLSNNNAHLLELKEKFAAEAETRPLPERPRDADGRFVSLAGDSFATAYPIDNLPYTALGNSCGYSNDYDASCAGGPAADVVYKYAPAVNQLVHFSLCNSGYDTQLSVYEDSPSNEIACNDDYCGLQSYINCLELEAGHTYYIVVDGFGGSNCGEYELNVAICGPCETDCPYGAEVEGEPVCYDDYVDDYNGGCNSTPPVFTPLECAGFDKGIATVCGTAGTYLVGGLSYRDTDWYTICLEETTQVGACLRSDYPMSLAIITPGSPDPCTDFTYFFAASGSDCEAACLDTLLPPGEYWIFAATTAFEGVPCGTPYLLYVRGCSPCEECQAEQPILALGDVRTVGYVWPFWEVQVRLTNTGGGVAGSVTSEMGSDLAWLQIPDNTCSYGDLWAGEHSYGEGGDTSYVFDLTSWPGGSFNAWFDITYIDSCERYHTVHLDPDFIDPEQATGVTAGGAPIAGTRLFPNKPNPFNPQTTISFEIPRAVHGEVAIFSAAGRLVRELWSGELESGSHSFVWSGNDDAGRAVPSGAYFYRLRTDDFTETRRMLLIR